MPESPPGHNSFRETLQNLRLTIGRYLDSKSADVDHRDVIKELYLRTELSGSYLAALIFANLIALIGLLSNSVAVVIGAMLISPLMGPIFSLGLSFAMGNLILARKAGKIIVLSLLLTVAAAAFFTVLSPLKEPTAEILARTRPNIYDLLVAIFAGAIGAIALCTRKNYLFTTTGIAIATAVIPPLSVVGYGLGTLQFGLAMGGFLLFFTNLVAIVISSDLVFMLLRFRSSMVEEATYPLKLRLRLLGVTLALISVPLITTLVSDISRLKLTKRIERTLKFHLNLAGRSRMTSFVINRDEGALKVLASVNTVQEFDQTAENSIKKALTDEVKKPLVLDLEQVVVKAKTIRQQEASASKPLLSAAPSQNETLATLRSRSMGLIKDACAEAGIYLAPWPIRECSISFSNGAVPVSLRITVRRDFPVSAQEQRWLSLAIAKKLEHPLKLELNVAPLIMPLTINGSGLPDEEGKKELAILKVIAGNKAPLQLTVAYPGTRTAGNDSMKKAELLKQHLVKDLGVPAAWITLKRGGSVYRVTVTEGR